MFPLLLAPVIKGITGMIGGSSKLAEGASKTAMKAAVLSASEDDKVQGNLSDSDDDSAGKKKKSEQKSMFGGLDLGRIKSAIGDSGEMGPMQEVKGGVYKQIFEVNKSMLSSLQRMETTMKLLLEVEYERIKGMVSLDASEKLEKGDTDKKTKPGKPGLLSKASKGAGKVFGGIKGGLGGNIGKLLGLGGLLFLFKNFEEEVKVAVQKMLKFFGDVYLYFTADDFTFAMFKEDLVNKFLPKIREISFKILDFLWGAIKGVATEWIFGSAGDARIQQESSSAMLAKGRLEDTSGDSLAGTAIAGMTNTNIAVSGNTRNALEKQGIDFKEFKAIQKELKATWKAMLKIYRESDKRIQWSGIGSMENSGNLDYTKYTISEIMNTTPIIDGVTYPSWDVLKDIKLQKMGGITKGMTEDRQDDIKKALAEKSTIARQIENVTNEPLSNIPLIGINSETERADDLSKLNEKLRLKNQEIKELGQIFAPTDNSLVPSDGGSVEALLKAEAEKKRIADDARDKNKQPIIIPPAVQGAQTFVDANQTTNMSIQAKNDYWGARLMTNQSLNATIGN